MRKERSRERERERVIGREMEEKREQKDDEREDNIHMYTAHIYITSRCCISLLGLPVHDLCRAPAEEFSMVTTAHYVDRCTWAAEVHTF